MPPSKGTVRVFLARHEDNLQLYKQIRSHLLGGLEMGNTVP